MNTLYFRVSLFGSFLLYLFYPTYFLFYCKPNFVFTNGVASIAEAPV